MWHQIFKERFPASIPGYEIVCVCAFPNMVDTLEKAKRHYQVDLLSNDKRLLDIHSDFNFNSRLSGSSVDTLPIYFEDTHPELLAYKEKYPEVSSQKSFFWAISYKYPKLSEIDGKRIVQSYSFKWYFDNLKYWFKNYYVEHSGIGQHLFVSAIYAHIYEKTKNFDQHLRNRRFDAIENKLMVFDLHNDFNEETCFEYIKKMRKTNIYEFILKAFK